MFGFIAEFYMWNKVNSTQGRPLDIDFRVSELPALNPFEVTGGLLARKFHSGIQSAMGFRL